MVGWEMVLILSLKIVLDLLHCLSVDAMTWLRQPIARTGRSRSSQWQMMNMAWAKIDLAQLS
jgi:hypothetical protein